MDIKVTRRAFEPRAPFECAICEHSIEDRQFSQSDHLPPLCDSCVRTWGNAPKYCGLTRGDRKAIQRLSAVTNRLSWEAYNGKYSQRGGTGW